MLVTTSKDLSFVQLGPFDLLAWQVLWVGGLFIGQRFLESKSRVPIALIGLTRAMAVDHGRDGIRVNAICPGYTQRSG
jgi:hypothetical protein